MNPDFLRVIAANPDDRRGLFLATARRDYQAMLGMFLVRCRNSLTC